MRHALFNFGMTLLLVFLLWVGFKAILDMARMIDEHAPEPTLSTVDTAPLIKAATLRAEAEFWRGYAAGLEQCGPMLGIKQ